jgi:hypothetical protein
VYNIVSTFLRKLYGLFKLFVMEDRILECLKSFLRVNRLKMRTDKNRQRKPDKFYVSSHPSEKHLLLYSLLDRNIYY